MTKKAKKYTKNYQNYQIWQKWPKMPKWPKITQYGQIWHKWPQMTKNEQNCQKWPKNAKNGGDQTFFWLKCWCKRFDKYHVWFTSVNTVNFKLKCEINISWFFNLVWDMYVDSSKQHYKYLTGSKCYQFLESYKFYKFFGLTFAHSFTFGSIFFSSHWISIGFLLLFRAPQIICWVCIWEEGREAWAEA